MIEEHDLESHEFADYLESLGLDPQDYPCSMRREVKSQVLVQVWKDLFLLNLKGDERAQGISRMDYTILDDVKRGLIRLVCNGIMRRNYITVVKGLYRTLKPALDYSFPCNKKGMKRYSVSDRIVAGLNVCCGLLLLMRMLRKGKQNVSRKIAAMFCKEHREVLFQRTSYKRVQGFVSFMVGLAMDDNADDEKRALTYAIFNESGNSFYIGRTNLCRTTNVKTPGIAWRYLEHQAKLYREVARDKEKKFRACFKGCRIFMIPTFVVADQEKVKVAEDKFIMNLQPNVNKQVKKYHEEADSSRPDVVYIKRASRCKRYRPGSETRKRSEVDRVLNESGIISNPKGLERMPRLDVLEEWSPEKVLSKWYSRRVRLTFKQEGTSGPIGICSSWHLFVLYFATGSFVNWDELPIRETYGHFCEYKMKRYVKKMNNEVKKAVYVRVNKILAARGLPRCYNMVVSVGNEKEKVHLQEQVMNITSHLPSIIAKGVRDSIRYNVPAGSSAVRFCEQVRITNKGVMNKALHAPKQMQRFAHEFKDGTEIPQCMNFIVPSSKNEVLNRVKANIDNIQKVMNIKKDIARLPIDAEKLTYWSNAVTEKMEMFKSPQGQHVVRLDKNKFRCVRVRNDAQMIRIVQGINESESWKISKRKPERVATIWTEVYNKMPKTFLKFRNRKMVVDAANLPYLYAFIKKKCLDVCEGKGVRKCRKPKHSCLRRVISSWRMTAEMKYPLRLFSRATEGIIRYLQKELENTDGFGFDVWGQHPKVLRQRLELLCELHDNSRCWGCDMGLAESHIAVTVKDAAQFFEQLNLKVLKEKTEKLVQIVSEKYPGMKGVLVPKSKRIPCELAPRAKQGWKFVPFAEITKMVPFFEELRYSRVGVDGMVKLTKDVGVPIGSLYSRAACSIVNSVEEFESCKKFKEKKGVFRSSAICSARCVDDLISISRCYCVDCLNQDIDNSHSAVFDPEGDNCNGGKVTWTSAEIETCTTSGTLSFKHKKGSIVEILQEPDKVQQWVHGVPAYNRKYYVSKIAMYINLSFRCRHGLVLSATEKLEDEKKFMTNILMMLLKDHPPRQIRASLFLLRNYPKYRNIAKRVLKGVLMLCRIFHAHKKHGPGYRYKAIKLKIMANKKITIPKKKTGKKDEKKEEKKKPEKAEKAEKMAENNNGKRCYHCNSGEHLSFQCEAWKQICCTFVYDLLANFEGADHGADGFEEIAKAVIKNLLEEWNMSIAMLKSGKSKKKPAMVVPKKEQGKKKKDEEEEETESEEEEEEEVASSSRESPKYSRKRRRTSV